jgi:hypothetical protein
MESNIEIDIKEQNKDEIEQKVEDTDKQEEKLDKIHLPKRKYALIHGYNGHAYSGNQK